ncbi:MAG: peptidoglycan-associated lipoprotein [Hyphomicrobiaceae bacterium]|jgi:peptidoglycan-associated lipoprotein
MNSFRFALILLVTFAASACGPRNYIVLLDNPDGDTGQVQVNTNSGEKTLDESGEAVAMDGWSRTRDKPWIFDQDRLTKIFGSVFSARPNRPESFVLYYEFATIDLTEESKETLVEIVKSIRRHPGTDATISAHTDRYDSDTRNETLAGRRAQNAHGYLTKLGVAADHIQIAAFGERLPAVPTADGIREARNRRVEITIR